LEVLNMKIRFSGVTSVFLLALLVSVCLAQAQDASIADASQLANDTVNASSAAGVDNSISTSESASSASVQGIWRISLGDRDIVAALNQSGESIFGPAKFEGDNPWNGAVAGSLSGNAISVSLAAVETETLASTYMSGTVEADSMKGSFVRSDSTGKATRGEFTATMIGPDTSVYTPAVIRTVSNPVAESIEESVVETGKLITAENNETVQQTDVAVPETVSRFKDVTQLAKGINPDILPRMAAL
jgi:hypothetical protein